MGKRVHPTTKYARDVVSRKILACLYVRQACQRHLDDLTRSDVYFDEASANHVLDFVRCLPHIEGKLAGQLFDPHPFQMFILGSVFGWKRKENGLRRFRYAYVEVPRKNTKSFLCSGIGLYGLCGDGEGGAQVYAAATKRDQAKIVWGISRKMVRRSEDFSQVIRPYHSSLVFDAKDSFFEPLASDSEKLDGLNTHVAIADELHRWTDPHLWYVIKDSMWAREQPLMVGITTAGNNQTGICYEQRQHVINMLQNGSQYDDRYFGYIATVDQGDDWTKPRTWKKANPMYGIVKKEEDFRAEVDLAKKIPSQEIEFKNTQLDIWTQVADRWLDIDKWKELVDERTVEDLKGKKCIAGVDLSSTTDLTAIAYVFPEEDDYYVWPVFFLPADTIEGRKNRVPYPTWREQGWLTTTLGGAVDQEALRWSLNEMNDIFDIEEVAIDPWNSGGLTPKLIDDGYEVLNIRQGYGSLSGPSKELEKLIVKEQIRHNGNPVLQWNVGNAVIDMDAAGNIKPNKDKSADKIDGVAAILNALARYLVREKPKESVYKRRGLRLIR